jgi:ketosteroid isomerase-like protein
VSSENAELARAMYEAWDPTAPDKWVADHLAADAEWHDAPQLPDSTTHHGIAETQAMVRGLVSIAGHFEMRIEEVIPAGDQAVVVFRMVGSGSESGVPIDLLCSHVLRFEDGRCTCAHAFVTREDGVRAAGLEVPR